MKRLAIIGGGFAGSKIAKSLENKFHTTLIDTKNYFEFTPGILRTIVYPEHIKKIQVLHKNYLKNTEIIIGEVKEVASKYVKVKNKKIFFDYLVVSSGSKYSSPIKDQKIIMATRASILRESFTNLCKSNTVLIIGGGLVGVELAAEICNRYKNKKDITLVHAKNHLIERNDEKASDFVEKYLRKRNVKIIFNERVLKKTGNFYLTNKGKKIKADAVFLCTGIVPNYSFMRDNFSSSLNEKNQIKVNSFLQVENHKSIFVAGDVSGTEVEKTAQNAEHQGKIVIKNLLALENKKALVNYTPKRGPLVISLGRYNGLYVNKDFIIKGKIPALMKYLVEKWEMFKKRF
ncbi:MAG: FAD-dependent oxidoreductase [Nanoarchaeota archaeon]